MATPAGVQEQELAAAFAVRVRQLRTQRELTQEQVARAAGLSVSWLRRVEKSPRSEISPRSITLALIQRFCAAFDVTYDELLGGLPVMTERYTRKNRRTRVSG
jgi:transcriptional regulator with XRE-family HTH domain